MGLTPGTRFGGFEIVSLLGAGGMGEVYRARDPRLNRDVALKVLPDVFAVDSDRLARFRREAQMLAALNHPNVAAIHGVEDAGGRHALVLELVEGPTLADRIAQGALPLDEALPIARQIVEALEAAHEQGIIHRDLKPANIKLRGDGAVKVLDFGLAKAMSRTDGASTSNLPDVTASPTVISPATMTSAGVILGTAAYMAPEQARGKKADHRADIWAFGCVLYEMLSGRRAFEGEEVTDTLAGILRGEPAWDALPASLSPSLRRLLRRCLDKNPRERLQAIGDARFELADALTGIAEPASATIVVVRQQSVLPLVATAAVAAIVVGAAAWMLKPGAPPSDARVTRSLIELDSFDHLPPAKPGETRPPVLRPDRTALALSPDGRTLVFMGAAFDVNPGGGRQSVLFVRPLDALTATPIPTTTGADSPFFSPDGAWIGYYDGELRRVPVAGSTTYTTIARLPPGEGSPRITGATWGEDDKIIFSAGGNLWRVPASGGSPERIVEKREDEYALKLPHLLPGGKTLLFTRQSSAFRWDDAQIIARSMADGQQKVLLEDAADARYVATGHLVFMRQGKLMAVPFDPESVTLRGGAVALIDNVMQAANLTNTAADSGAGQFAISAGGTLVYATGGVRPEDQREFVWVSRDGTAEPISAPKREWVAARLSPDSQRIATFTGDQRVWVYDITRGTLTPVTSQQERGAWGIFSPDGTRVVFASSGSRSLMASKAVDGNDKPKLLVPAARAVQSPNSWSKDDKIAFVQNSETTRNDIWVFEASSGKAAPLIQTEAGERWPAFSPDGKWLAYSSDLTGRDEVYVQPYPGPGPRVLVSSSGGGASAWAGDNRELFYVTNNQNAPGMSMMSVKITTTSSGLSAGVPQRLFGGQYSGTTPARGWDVMPDGRRFLMVRSVETPPPPPSQMILVQNFGEELKRRVK